ncbi:uncharacterized membrane protein (DUF373 family) [Lysobacter niastensis]|uniref:Uncharacterized membrane protein (DUF373 family) n=1 Tax=Lysobacter niastensis TaxID=380629 RepID=A0ABU1WDI4_9GAMM|nr:phosphate-starvation-inducible PsiE family protein [Lysobacter niastensis]MDR7135668.1 uncharacterized membrane protein (DUF373 family) [Lysobacter niastensis]
MKDLWPKEAFTRGFEHWVVSAVQVLLMVMIVLGLLDLVYLLFRGARSDLLNIQTTGELQRAMQQGFAGILLVLIGLELLETVRAYLKSHRIRLEVVLIVAVIALGRHIVELELEDVDGLTLVGIAALIAALVGGYYLARRLRADTALSSTTASREEIKQ